MLGKPLVGSCPRRPLVGISGNTLDGTAILNTHLQNSPTGGVKDRADQVNAILEYAGELKEPTVLTGDMNAEPTWPEIQPFYGTFDDAWIEGGDGGPGYTFEGNPPTRRIDYVFVSPDIKVSETTVPQTLASDHKPVVAKLSLPGEAIGVGPSKR